MTSIALKDVSYTYGSKIALEDVTFSIEQGQFCALLGPNGAGKSTLFSLLTGLFYPLGGSINLGHSDIVRERRKALSEIGVVFQQTTLDIDLSVEENLRYFAALHGITGQRARRRISDCLELLNMSERSKEPVRALNGGHKRRTEIARSLIHDPSILLLDEPTVGLDPETRTSITENLHQLAEDQGKTILWATHLTDEIYEQDHVVILHQGKVVSQGPVNELCQGRSLRDVFLEKTA